MLASLNDRDTFDAIRAERAFQASLGLGCGVPVGAHAVAIGDELIMRGMMAEADGSQYREITLRGRRDEAAEIGIRLAEELLKSSCAQPGE